MVVSYFAPVREAAGGLQGPLAFVDRLQFYMTESVSAEGREDLHRLHLYNNPTLCVFCHNPSCLLSGAVCVSRH
jgi:hypothetical protein